MESLGLDNQGQSGSGFEFQTKSLSVNNVYLQFDLTQRHDGCGQVVQGEETAIKLLVSYEQFAKPVEPTMPIRLTQVGWIPRGGRRFFLRWSPPPNRD